jgi:hypothetical protein
MSALQENLVRCGGEDFAGEDARATTTADS